MLHTTLATRFVPGTNVKGQVAGANWSFLLPSMELDRVLCVGVPLPGTLQTLSRLGREVIVLAPHGDKIKRAQRYCQDRGLTNLCFAATGALGKLALHERNVDLLLLADRRSQRRWQRDTAWREVLGRALRPEGLIYFEGSAAFRGTADNGNGSGGDAHTAAPQSYWLTPLRGEMQTAVPADDSQTIEYFYRQTHYSPLTRRRILRRIEPLLARPLLLGRWTRRHGALAGNAVPTTYSPPKYLQAIARRAGEEIGHDRWGLAAHGLYSSRKVLFFLFERDSKTPRYIAKMTRDATFNGRLENEFHALQWLHAGGLDKAITLPRPVFFDYHAGLAVLGQSIVDGEPFARRTRFTAECPAARSAIDSLTNLGATSLDATSISPGKAADAFVTLLRRFEEIYAVPRSEREFLSDQIDTIAGQLTPFPVVFQHGDPGTWNALVTPDGRAALLDWEAAETQGVPLWDLFYFLRSYCVGASRHRGVRNSLTGFARHFLAESPLTPLLQGAVDRYRRRCRVPAELVEPLFYLCWMHRSLKEATRLPRARLDRGHYVRLLRLCIERRFTPALRRLLCPQAPRRMPISIDLLQTVS